MCILTKRSMRVAYEERYRAWIDSFRTLLIRSDVKYSNWLNWHYLAFALI